MRRPRPLFLPAQGYRRRRLHDAARLLPVFGAVLFLLPVLWSPATTVARDTAPDGIYLFVIWGALIGVAGMLSRGLVPPAPGPDAEAAPGAVLGAVPGAGAGTGD